MFWTLFKPEPFEFKPEVHVSTYYSIGALVVMVPAIYFYNTGYVEIFRNFVCVIHYPLYSLCTQAVESRDVQQK